MQNINQTNIENIQKSKDLVLSISSPESILENSSGEVMLGLPSLFHGEAPEDPLMEDGGLFSQVIFGPIKDWFCKCQKYQGKEYLDKECEICHVKISSSDIRAEKMGHINLPLPFVHPLYIDQIGILINVNKQEMEEILNFKSYQITKINIEIINDFLDKINKEASIRVQKASSDYLKTGHELIEEFPEGIESGEYTLKLKKASSEKVQTILNISQIKKTAQDELYSLKLDSVMNKADLDKILQKFPNSFESKTGPELLEHLLKEIIPENEVVEIEKLLDLEENKYNYGFEKNLH